MFLSQELNIQVSIYFNLLQEIAFVIRHRQRVLLVFDKLLPVRSSYVRTKPFSSL
jgi:hypothetical protein